MNKKYAQIKNSIVISILEIDINDEPPVSIKLVPCDDNITIGMFYDSTTRKFSDKYGSIGSMDATRNKLFTMNNEYFNLTLDRVFLNECKNESITWPIQIEEARSILSGNSDNVIFLKRVASGRSMDLELLAKKVLQARDVFALFASDITAVRQSIEDRIKQAISLSELKRIEDAIPSLYQSINGGLR